METFDASWEQIHRNQEWGRYPSEEVIRFVARNYYSKQRTETRLLDAGCGTGAVTWYLARENFDVYAFDGSQTAIKNARERMQHEGLNATLEVCDAANLKYNNEFFDGIIDSAMIYANTVESIKAILKECHRVLKKHGKMFSTGLFKIGMSGFGSGEKLEENTYRNIEEGSLAGRGTVHFFDKKQILDFWTEAGFNNIRLDSLDRTDMGRKVSYFMVEAKK